MLKSGKATNDAAEAFTDKLMGLVRAQRGAVSPDIITGILISSGVQLACQIAVTREEAQEAVEYISNIAWKRFSERME